MDKYIGKILDDRYEITEIIGIGGMAVVYKARCRLLNRYVAVKILKEEFIGDTDLLKRFHDESQAVAMLSHNNILSVYDVSRGEVPPYIVMELIDGITLKQYMQQKAILNIKEALYLTAQILRALRHAHSKNIVHRDIKPHNIMVLKDSTVKVADFGIAKMTSQNTVAQQTIGSVHYISPEQAKGSVCTPQSDLYSVGVVMYEMLAGVLPFTGDNPISIAMMHVNTDIVPPTSINPNLPTGVEEIIMKALRKDLSERYQSADEMLRDVELLRQDLNISFAYDFDSRGEDLNSTKKIRLDEIKKYKANGEKAVMKKAEKNKNRLMIASVMGAFALFAAIIVVVINLLGIIDEDVSEFRLPNFIGKDYNEIMTNPEYTSKLEIIQKEIIYSADYPEGTVIKQDPQPNIMVKEGSTVYVDVSRGTKEIVLADYRNYEYRQAGVMLSKLGLNFTEEYVFDDEILEGYVVKTSPAAKEKLKEGDTVILYVSRGREIKYASVPKLLGMKLEEAKRAIETAGFVEGSIVETESEEPVNTVIEQSVAPGTDYETYSTIDIKVSKGKSKVFYENITFVYPADLPSGIVKIYQDKTLVYEAFHEKSEYSVTATLKGNGTSYIEIYINDTLIDTRVIDFK